MRKNKTRKKSCGGGEDGRLLLTTKEQESQKQDIKNWGAPIIS